MRGLVHLLAVCCLALSSCVTSGADDAATTTDPPPDSTVSQPTTTTLTRTSEHEPQPQWLNEPLIAPGWEPIASFDERFVIRSVTTTERGIYVAGGDRPADHEEPIPTEVIVQLTEHGELVRTIDRPLGDVAAFGGGVAVFGPDGLWWLDEDEPAASRLVDDGDWTDAFVLDDGLLTMDGRRWLQGSDVPTNTIQPPALTIRSSVAGIGDDIYVLDQQAGFWHYDGLDDEWRREQAPDLFAAARSLTVADGELLAADYEMDAARWLPERREWEPLPALPLRFSECLPQPFTTDELGGFQLCSGSAVWRGDGWVTVPLGPGLTTGAAEATLFSTRHHQLQRYVIRVIDGEPTFGPTVPVGRAMFDPPFDWTVLHQEASDSNALGGRASVLVLEAPDRRRCELSASYRGIASPEGEPTPNRRGQHQLVGRDDDALLISSRSGSDVVRVTCDDADDAELLVHRVWSRWHPVDPHWFDPGPLTPRGGHAVTWSGDEVLVWGGAADENGGVTFGDGAAYHPTRRTWRAIAPGPLETRSDHIGAFVGSEMLVVGGAVRTDAAAYNPAADTWRRLADPPLPLYTSMPWTTTSDGLSVWSATTGLIASYDLLTDIWTTMAAPDIGGTPSSLVVMDDSLVAVAATRGTGSSESDSVSAHRLEASGWIELPSLEMAFDQRIFAASSSGRVLAWSDLGPSAYFESATDRWTTLDPAPIEPCEATGDPVTLADRVLAVGWCGTDAVFDPGALEWTAIELPGLGDRRTTVWTGTELISWGDTCCYGTGGRPFSVSPWQADLLEAATDRGDG